MLRFATAAAVVLATTSAALAADFYIVRGPDKKCTIVEKKPVDKTIVIVGDRAYVTREEAEKQLKVVCK